MSISAYIRVALGILMLCHSFGCAAVNFHDEFSNVSSDGWITVGGASVPSTTVPVKSYGKSLAQTVLDSQVPLFLKEQKRFSVVAHEQPSSQPALLDFKAARSIVSEPYTHSDTPLKLSKELSLRVSSLRGSFSGIEMPPTWFRGWPHFMFDKEERDGAAISKALVAASRMLELNYKTRAVGILRSLQDTSASVQEPDLEYLSELARDGKIEVSEEQKQNAWCYYGMSAKSKLFALLNGLQQKLATPNPEVATLITTVMNNPDMKANVVTLEQIKLNLAEAELGEDIDGAIALAHRIDEFENNLIGLRVPESKNSVLASQTISHPEDASFVFIQKQGGANLLLPFESVFESELGSIWLFPGDRINIVKFRELPASEIEPGPRNVAVVGMIGTPGFLQTSSTKADDIIREVSDEVHEVSNVVTISSDWNGVIVHSYFPQGTSHSAVTQASITALLGQWDVADGSVIRFDNLTLSTLIAESKRLQQAAAAENVNSDSRLCLKGHGRNNDMNEDLRSSRLSGLNNFMKNCNGAVSAPGPLFMGWLEDARDGLVGILGM